MTPYRYPLPRVLILGALVLVLCFWILIPTHIQHWQAIMIQSVRGIMSIVVVVVYTLTMISLWNEKEPNAAHVAVLAILLAFVADAYSAAQSILWRMGGMPPEWTGYSTWTFGPWLTAVAAILLVLSPGSMNGLIPKRNVFLASAGVAIALLVAGIIIGVQLSVMGVQGWVF